MTTALRAILLLQPHVGYPVHGDCHPFHEMIIVLRGTYRAESDGQDIELLPGQAVCYPARVLHRVRPGSSDVTFYCIQWDDPCGPGDEALLADDPSQRLAMAARWLHDVHHRPERDAHQEVGLLTALVGEVCALAVPGRSDHDAIESVRRVLMHNFCRVQSLTNLAMMAGLSPSQLNRSFRRRFGCTVMSYLRQVRIEAALAMLTNRQASLDEVAGACGFNRASYLVRVIRDHTGLTPGQIRRGVVPAER